MKFTGKFLASCSLASIIVAVPILLATPTPRPLSAATPAQTSDPTPVSTATGLPSKVIGAETVVLNGSTIWTIEKLQMADGAQIVTGPYSLTIVAQSLEIKGSASIVAVAEDRQALNRELPPPTGRGADGASHDPGPGTEGPSPSGRGADGGPGAPGAPGLAGRAGDGAGITTLVVTGTASGHLTIKAKGGDGQPGGNAGGGGSGGSGQQGGRGVTEYVLGVPVGCKSGPGGGGNGGPGASGGPGGSGGAGGNAGTIAVSIQGNHDQFTLKVNMEGGKGGPGGLGGAAGSGGGHGWGGRGNVGVHGREQERKGSPGGSGAAGAVGVAGPNGLDGRIESNVPFTKAE